MNKFLVLGAGFVAESMVEYLNRNPNNQITVLSYTLKEAQLVANKFKLIGVMQADVSNEKTLNTLVIGYDVVVSLVPAPLHVLIAKACIKQKIHMVTASYQTPEMMALSNEAKAAGICILNEVGLDPGIDHLAAMDIIDKVHERGESVESFVSWCGGIPAPENNDNPLGYKFSWEPRGAIMDLLNDASYQKNMKQIKVAGANLMQWHQNIEFNGLNLECYPNRESVSYKNIYGINEVKDIFRGTLRYQGFCDIFQDLKNLGLMQVESGKISAHTSWKDYIIKLNNMSIEEIKTKISQKSYQALDWLGLFSDKSVAKKDCSIDALCDLLLKKLSYKPKETDMVILQHKFVVKRQDGSVYFIKSTLNQIGNSNGYNAMAKTVGYPVAIAAQLIAEKKIQFKGMMLPITKETYRTMLSLLKKEGITFKEEIINQSEISKEDFLKELV